ncbi:MAG TPA: ABC transporter permease [Trebonia sp.]
MWKVTIRGLLAHKLRLALTTLAIVLAVTFIAGTLVLTDTLNGTFAALFGNVYQKIDFVVRGNAEFGASAATAARKQLPDSLISQISRIPGVQTADGEVDGYARFVSRSGQAIGSSTTSTLGVSIGTDPQLSGLRLVQGALPTTAAQVVMDEQTAGKYGFRVGQPVKILLTGGPKTFTVSGIAEFGTIGDAVGSAIAAFSLPTAQSVLDSPGVVNTVNILTTPGASQAQVQKDIEAILPSGDQVVTGQAVAGEQTSAVSQQLSFFSTALLVFALVSLFVGAFTILNTFSIIVGQRVRELALLRIVGASRSQVFTSVLAEAALVGLVSSGAGLGLGVLAAIGLRALIGDFGITLPPGPLAFEPRTVIVSLAVGTGVTVLAAVLPAADAVRVPPVAALRGGRGGERGAQRGWLARGTALALILAGAAGLGLGLPRASVPLVGLGALCVFLSVLILAPALARPLAGLIGRPLARLLGLPGRLGRENSMRNPKRTARTASALMIGLALVAAVSVFGASLAQSAANGVNGAIKANLIVTATSSAAGGFSTRVPATAAGTPGVTAATSIYQGQAEIRGSVVTLTAVTTAQLADTAVLHLTAGRTSALSTGDLLIDTTTAAKNHLSVGDTVPVTFARTGPATLPVGGIYQTNSLVGSYLISAGRFTAHFASPQPVAVLLATSGGAGTQGQVSRALAQYPDVEVQTTAQYEQAQVSSVNQLLGLVYALLALAVLIALIGIVNTLMLSVFERTREIGLLRAVGMQRGQVRMMIRSESVIIAVFGAVVGIVSGTLLGLAFSAALRRQGVAVISVPGSRLLLFLFVAAVLGLVAASLPARRAARLDVLTAIGPE